ncbi:hypothetical protein [Nereida sp. MMG025]|uniref:hypothetical protein n=1 Tax=Nereida sp. MMG025 TaxID=2909981 RepID=UPI001F31487E|nr:hypothetical protein [Nereida sp. MMG025]MCF6444685.1 hypothetical protein [Nereida sp. MMG025]
MAKHAGRAQALAAQNVANADTPNYQRKTIAPFQAELGQAAPKMRATRAGHVTAHLGPTSAAAQTASNAAPNGNSVSLQEEMLASVDAKRQHDRAIAIYKSSLTVLRASLGRR